MRVQFVGEVLNVVKGEKNGRQWSRVIFLGDTDTISAFCDEDVAIAAQSLVRAPVIVEGELSDAQRGYRFNVRSVQARKV